MIAEVIINSNVKNLDKTFDYNIPIELEDKVKVGSRVLLQFGNMKRLEEGFVVGIKEKSDYKVKEIKSVENSYLNEEKIELAKWIQQRYFCNLSDAIKLMLPPGTTTKVINNRVKEKNINYVQIAKEPEEIEIDIENKKLKSEKQIKILKFLIENGQMPIADLELFTDTSRNIIKTLENKGYLNIIEKEVERNPFLNKQITKSNKLVLTDEQEKAYKEIEEAIEDGMHSEFLLFGVTGSGKTEVYLQLIDKVLQEEKSSIMLVPEISLTPQTVNRFISRFGEEKIAVLHSKLSVGERYDQWQKIRKGIAKIIIGARSAIFAPAKDLGIIIIDEEHDQSYKSEMTPRYHAKEVASYIANKKNIPLVLGSATPSLDTYFKGLNGDIEILELNKRANKMDLPDVQIVDLRQELANGNRSMISYKLHEEIQKNLKDKKQTILFLNRRGFSTFVMCRDCGYTAKCKNCDVTLTYHNKEKKLKCHYCGYETNVLSYCPECKSNNIRYFGTGTQKLETEINKLFPNASTIRMDIDTVTKKDSHEKILSKFQNENVDILIGTQMIVKGHHFPNVTLVGVIAADSSLNIEDYRANEKTFQILTQVAGRAGREEKGRVIIQTYNPDSFSIEYAKKQNYKLFYNTEIILRKSLKYPPFCDIIMLLITGKDEKEVIQTSKKIHIFMKEKMKQDNLKILLYSPVPSPIDKIKNKYRWRIIVKCKFDDTIIKLMNETQEEFYNLKKSDLTRIIIDLNPNNML